MSQKIIIISVNIVTSKQRKQSEKFMNLQQLANELNVTEKEVIALIKMIYISMNKDSVGEMLLNMDEKDKVEMVNAYVQSEVKKFSEFCVTLLTNEEKRKAFELYVQSQVI